MKRYAVILVAVMLLLAGCTGGPGGQTTADTDVATADGTTTTETTGDDTDSSESQGTMNFYVSDEENAMEDFEHLNVTISKVGLKRANESSTNGSNANESDGGWTTYDVDNRTVDLTELKGANATRLGTFGVENGDYETVFVHVNEVNGTLKNGESVRVKLPSSKLQIHQDFTVGPNQSLDYVFDISVFKAGQSGKYVLKPVISESGTDKEIKDVDEKEDEDEREGDEDEREDDEDDNEEEDREEDNETDERDIDALNATFVGNVTAGENATVSVTHNGSAVANATVSVNGDVVGQTSADGTLTFEVPDRKNLEVEIETEDESTKLTATLESGGEKNGDQGGDN